MAAYRATAPDGKGISTNVFHHIPFFGFKEWMLEEKGVINVMQVKHRQTNRQRDRQTDTHTHIVTRFPLGLLGVSNEIKQNTDQS